MKQCTLEIKDEVNVKFHGLDVTLRKKMSDRLRFFVPAALHTPAYKLKRWDGTITFCDTGARTYIHLVDKVIDLVVDSGYDITVDDKRKNATYPLPEVTDQYFSHIKWPEGHPLEAQPIELRDYQENLLKEAVENTQSIMVAPTAAGKTIVTAGMASLAGIHGRSVTIVPTKDLVTQTEEDFLNVELDTGVYFGDRKDFTREHTICTWQSLERLNRDDPSLLCHYLEGVVAVIVDECHRAKGEVLKALLSGPFKNVPIRWGLTGTMPDNEPDEMSVIACIGPIVGKLTARELQEKGYLAKCQINVKQMLDFKEFTSYQSELKWLTTDPGRIDKIASMIAEISETGNTLVLIDRVQTGKMMLKSLEAQGMTVPFIYGNVKSDKRKSEYKSMQSEDNKIIIASYGVASTGISINRIFNLVLIEPGKSFVRVIQSIGRGLRIAQDKDHVEVYDITSNCKYAKRHLTKRKRFYKEAEYPFSIKKINYRD